jgi:signal transduction histidine kinase
MAAVATNVVHNIGNALNSMNVSVDLAKTRLQGSKLPGLGKALQLIHEHQADLGGFFSKNPRGEQVIEYLHRLSSSLGDEQSSIREELDRLASGLEHVKRIVMVQQGYARVSGVREAIQVPELLKDAVGLNRAGGTQTDVEVVYDLKSLPPVSVDKHDVMQVLVNLVSNAQDAMRESTGRKVLKLCSGPHPTRPTRFFIQVQDTGVGVPAENLVRIFSHGFTTKADGHGFGLHSAALAATNMGGRLYAASEGVDRGATFTLELPMNADDHDASAGDDLEGVA